MPRPIARDRFGAQAAKEMVGGPQSGLVLVVRNKKKFKSF
jgi:hypothetical protein